MDDERLKLQKLTIGGYKSFSSNVPQTIGFGDITVLLGANGAGKSNIVSFFRMLGFAMGGKFESYVKTAGTAETFLYYGSKKNRQIEGTLEFKSNKDTDKYSFVLAHAAPDNLIFTSEIVEWERVGKSELVKRPLKVDYQESALYSSLDDTDRTIKKILADCKVYQFHDTSVESRLRTMSHVNQSNYLMSDGGNLATFLYELRRPTLYRHEEYYDRIVSYIRLVMPQFHDFILKPNAKGYLSLTWKDNSANDYIFIPDQISDGSLRFMALTTLLLQPPDLLPRVIILDEPELGLHPVAVTQLAEMVKQASEHTQVIIATQSPQLADEFSPSDIVIVERGEETNSTVCKRLDENALAEWLKEYSVSELWNKNVFGGRP